MLGDGMSSYQIKLFCQIILFVVGLSAFVLVGGLILDRVATTLEKLPDREFKPWKLEFKIEYVPE